MGNYGIAVHTAARSFSLFRRMLLVMAFLSPANNAKGFLKLKFLAISGKKVLISWGKSDTIKEKYCCVPVSLSNRISLPILVGSFYFMTRKNRSKDKNER